MKKNEIDEQKPNINQVKAVNLIFKKLEDITDDETYSEMEFDEINFRMIWGYNYHLFFQWDDTLKKTRMHLNVDVNMKNEYACEIAAFLTSICYTNPKTPIVFKCEQSYFITDDGNMIYGDDAYIEMHKKIIQDVKCGICMNKKLQETEGPVN
jgi:hypothetical protein